MTDFACRQAAFSYNVNAGHVQMLAVSLLCSVLAYSLYARYPPYHVLESSNTSMSLARHTKPVACDSFSSNWLLLTPTVLAADP